MSQPPAAAPGQSWDPERYARSARFVADLGVPLIELLNPRPGERILDLGCGDGALTEKLAAACRGKRPAAAGGVIGIDSSPDQVAAARKRGLDVHVGDGQRLAYTNEFDAVFSNAALHWMPDGDAVLAGIWRALKPGGRFVAECGGAGNVSIIVSAVSRALRERGTDPEPLDPWVFPAPDDYARRLRPAAYGPRLHGRFHPLDPAADPPAGRHRRVAGNVRRQLSGRRPAQGSGHVHRPHPQPPASRIVRVGRCVDGRLRAATLRGSQATVMRSAGRNPEPIPRRE